MGRTLTYTPKPHPAGRTLAHKIGIHEVARRSGVSVTHVSKIFGSGTRRPSMKTGKKLAQAMGITLDQLYVEVEKASRAA